MGGWGVEGNGRAEDGGTVGDGDAMRHGGAAVDGPHMGAYSFYSHRIGGPVGHGGIQMLCGDVCPDAPLKPGVRALGASL